MLGDEGSHGFFASAFRPVQAPVVLLVESSGITIPSLAPIPPWPPGLTAPPTTRDFSAARGRLRWSSRSSCLARRLQKRRVAGRRRLASRRLRRRNRFWLCNPPRLRRRGRRLLSLPWGRHPWRPSWGCRRHPRWVLGLGLGRGWRNRAGSLGRVVIDVGLEVLVVVCVERVVIDELERNGQVAIDVDPPLGLCRCGCCCWAF